jgi:2-iminobutanoate/2-iminopropanoate deaminase
MPLKEGFSPPDSKNPNQPPYTPAVAVGDQVFVSGQGPIDPQTGRISGQTLEEQVELTLNNVKRVLESARCSMEDCVKITAYLANMADFDRYNVIYRKFFTTLRPARTTVEAKLWGGILIEIDAIAIRGCGQKAT